MAAIPSLRLGRDRIENVRSHPLMDEQGVAVRN